MPTLNHFIQGRTQLQGCISLLIPCYNEADQVPDLCRRLRPVVCRLQRESDVEVLFVDDGSEDGTGDIIRREGQGLPFRLVSHNRHRGLGAALRTGFAQCRGDEIVTLDSDCTYDPEQVDTLLQGLRNGAGVVTGSPYHPDGRVEGVDGRRILLSRSVSRFYALLVPGGLHTYTSLFRAYRKSVLPLLDLSDDGFLAVTRILVSALQRGVAVEEVPAVLTARKAGKGKMDAGRMVLDHLRYLSGLVWLRLFGGNRRIAPAAAPAQAGIALGGRH